MPAMSRASISSAMLADRNGGEPMPSCMQQAACQTTHATASHASITETSVDTLVSLFARVLSLRGLLLVVILTLSGLTGLTSLVGLTTKLSASAEQGD